MRNGRSKRNLRSEGTLYEDLAADHLSKQGLSVLERNFRSRFGEIDIIARDRDAYVFIEVKYRSGSGSGDPAEAVGPSKQKTIRRQALYWLAKNGLDDMTPCRFDVVSINADKIRWIRNAF